MGNVIPYCAWLNQYRLVPTCASSRFDDRQVLTLDHAALHEASCKTVFAPADCMLNVIGIIEGGRIAGGYTCRCAMTCNSIRRLHTEPTLVSEQRGTTKISSRRPFAFSRYIEGYFGAIMSSLSSKSKAASGVGFLGIAAVVTLHKVAAIAENAHYKPDTEAHEVKLANCVRACKYFFHLHAAQIESRDAVPNDLHIARSGHQQSGYIGAY